MREIWSEPFALASWLRIEQTLAAVQAEMGAIPAGAALALAGVAPAHIDPARLKAETETVGRPIVGFVRQLRERVGREFAAYVHYGTTTQDILDTATMLQMQSGIGLVRQGLDAIVHDIEILSAGHARTAMIGRTNGQYAKPITFGSKTALWAAELRRRGEVLDIAAERGIQVQLGGPVGNLDSFDPEFGRELRRRVAQRLGLRSADLPWQNNRDALGDIVLALGQLGTSLEKISHNVNLLSSSEIAELYELPEKDKGASSAMAHKRNQRCSEFGEALGHMARCQAMQIGGSAGHEHERSGGKWIVEWLVVPDVFLYTSGALLWVRELFRSLQVDTGNMRRNLDLADAQIRQRLSSR